VIGRDGHGVKAGELKNAYIILAENLKGRYHLRVLAF